MYNACIDFTLYIYTKNIHLYYSLHRLHDISR